MNRWLPRLTFALVALSVVLLGVLTVAITRMDLVAPLWTPRGLVGLLTALILGSVALGALALCALMARALWPRQVERNVATLQAFPLRCTLLGILALLGQVFLVGRSLAGVHGLIFLAFVLWDLVALSQGFPALAELAGERLGVAAGPRATAVGTAVVACGSTVPVVGWLMGLGVFLQSLGVSMVPQAWAVGGVR